MDAQTSSPRDIAAIKRELGLDETQQFAVVVNDGVQRISQGQTPVLPYKDITDPKAAYYLARLEWHLRGLIQQQQGNSHLLPNAERLDRAHYRIHLAPWLTGIEPITELRELALQIVRKDANPVTLEVSMNGVTVLVRWSSKPHLLHRDWVRALNGCINGPIGPSVPASLTPEDELNDRRVHAANETHNQIRRMELNAMLKARKAELDARLEGLPEMEIGNGHQEQLWQEAAASEVEQFVITFGKTWARLMQAEMAKGELLENAITPTFYLALGDHPALYGSEVGAALNYVALTWAHRSIFLEHVHKISTVYHVA